MRSTGTREAVAASVTSDLPRSGTADEPEAKVARQALAGLASLALLLWLVLFLTGGSLGFWQAWVYWILFVVSVSAISIYLLRHDMTLIKNRLEAGPGAEGERVQKVAQVLIGLFFILIILVPSLDHRFRWSTVPIYLVAVGDIFVMLGLATIFLVFKENSHASTAVRVNEGQEVVSTGPYRVVRHPMYAGALVMLLFTPLALGSYWGLAPFLPMFLVIVVRLAEEEKFLRRSLSGYDEYCKRVRYHLIPLVW